MPKSYHDEYTERFAADQLLHHFGQRDEQGQLWALEWYASGENKSRKVDAFMVEESTDSESDTLGDEDMAKRVERQTWMVRRVGRDGLDVPMDTEALVLIPGDEVYSGRWGVERIDPTDKTFAQVVLIREKAKRYYGTGYER